MNSEWMKLTVERKEEIDGEIEVSSRVHKPKARPELKQHGVQKSIREANDERKIMIKNL